MPVAIVGAGVTGLSVAYLLLKQGVEVVVYEASDREGGLAATVQHEGFEFDLGPHEFCTDNHALVALLQEVCGDDLLHLQKRTAQHFMGRFVPYPFGIGDVIRSIPPWLTVRAMFEVGWRRATSVVRRARPESFRAWTIEHFGPTLYDLYFGPYTQKVWGVDPDQLDERTASQRITVDSAFDLLKKMIAHGLLRRDDFGKTHSEFRAGFHYTRHGAGGLLRHLRRRVAELGGRFEFGRRMSALDVDERRQRVTRLRFADGSETNDFDYLVSTAPLPLLLRATFGARGDELLRQNPLPFRGMVFVFLGVDRPKVTDNHWIYFPSPELPFQRWTEFVHFGADMCPPGKTSLTLEVACDPDDATWARPDREIVDDCIRHVERLGLLRRDEVVAHKVMRTPYAYPVQVRGYVETSERLLGELVGLRNVISIGRQGLFRYCNQNECMEMAMDVVPQILAGEESIRYTREGSWVGVGITDAT
jgi:protoporphyrinogen oxidase